MDSHEHHGHRLPVDPDTEPVPPARRWDIALVVAAGGALGGAARHGLTTAWPAAAGGVPWSTLAENVLGSFLLGALMVVLLEVREAPSRYARPFLGVGVLGGFTTFSAYAAQVVSLARDGLVVAGTAYALGTLLAALLAAAGGIALTRRMLGVLP